MTALRACRLDELVEAVPAARIVGDPATRVTGLTYDSRRVRPGDLFAALPGADVDGHRFLPDAQRGGAHAALVERLPEGFALPAIVVPDSRAALAGVAAVGHGHPSAAIGVIGVTGTDGKTTTSYLIDAILRAAGYVTGLIGTVTVRVGDHVVEHDTRQTTPESADVQRFLRAMVDTGATWAVVEATSHGLAMHRLDHVRFQVGAVTNVTHEHLEFHGTLDAYRRAKAVLFERVAAVGGTAVINLDDDGARAMLPFADGARIVRYSAEGRAAEITARDVVSDARGSRFGLATSDWGSAEVNLPFLGGFNVANALCAAGVALAAGVDLATVVRGLATATPVPGRMATIAAGQPFTVVVDYAHTPESLAKVLTLLRDLHPGGRLIAVFGSAGERDVAKRPLQGAVAARLANFSVFTSEDPRHEDADAIIAAIAAGAREAGGRAGETFTCVTDRRQAIRHAVAAALPGDCVLLAGKGHEGSIIWGRTKVPWDEAAVARDMLAERGFRQLDQAASS